MTLKTQLQQLFSDLNKKIRYVYFRDATYLYETVLKTPGDDIDLLISREDVHSFIEILHKHNYIAFQNIKSHTRKIGFFHRYDTNAPTFDVHINRIHKVRYIKGKEFLNNTTLEQGIRVLKPKQKLLILVLKDLFLISFFGLKKYSKSKQKEIRTLLKDKKYENYLKKMLKTYLGSTSEQIIPLLQDKNFEKISSLKPQLILALISNQPKTIGLMFYNLFSNHTRHLSLQRKVVSILGVDGSGKSTLVDTTHNFLRTHHISCSQLYMGRWVRTTTIKKMSTLSNKTYAAKKKKPFWIIWGRDLLYFFKYISLLMSICLRKINHRFILSDRYVYDLLTQKDTTILLSFFAKYLYPKPTLTILLYQKPAIIFSRKKEQTIEKLTYHQQVLAACTKRNKGYFVLSSTPQESFDTVVDILLYQNNRAYSFLDRQVDKLQKAKQIYLE